MLFPYRCYYAEPSVVSVAYNNILFNLTKKATDNNAN